MTAFSHIVAVWWIHWAFFCPSFFHYFFFPCTLLMAADLLVVTEGGWSLSRQLSQPTTQVVSHHLNRLLTVWTKIDHLCSRHGHVGCHTTCVWLFTPPRLPSCSLNIDSLPCWLWHCWPLGRCRLKYLEQCNSSFFPHTFNLQNSIWIFYLLVEVWVADVVFSTHRNFSSLFCSSDWMPLR